MLNGRPTRDPSRLSFLSIFSSLPRSPSSHASCFPGLPRVFSYRDPRSRVRGNSRRSAERLDHRGPADDKTNTTPEKCRKPVLKERVTERCFFFFQTLLCIDMRATFARIALLLGSQRGEKTSLSGEITWTLTIVIDDRSHLGTSRRQSPIIIPRIDY